MQVIDLTDEHMYFVTRCTHDDETNEDSEKVAPVRETWLRENLDKGLRVKVAVDNGKPVGFAHCLPIELGAWGMSGTDIMTVPCLTLKYSYVYGRKKGSGYGRALIEAVEAEAVKTKKGVAIPAYDNAFWFMPASFFEKLGYHRVAQNRDAVIMLKEFETVEPPVMHRMNYRPALIPDKVVVDAFWNPVCMTSLGEILHVRDVCSEYGDEVVLNEYNCGDKDILEQFQISRALFINGENKDWGYAAPRDGLRKEINSALEKLTQS